jgi:uncharacterized protein (DUF302 family)
MKKTLYSFLFVFALSANAILFASDDLNDMEKQAASFAHVFSLKSSFEDAKQDLLASIADKGLVISYTSHARAMFERTKNVTGETTPIYDNAEILLFCKADLSYKLVKSNPHKITLCPYQISIYVLHADPQTVYLSFPKHAYHDATTQSIVALLSSIINDVVE